MNDTIQIQLQVAVFRKRAYWIAYAPALKTFGYSTDSKEAALDDFDKAIDTFIEVHSKLNTFHQSLLALGWTHTAQGLETPKYFNSEVQHLPDYDKVDRNIRIPA